MSLFRRLCGVVAVLAVLTTPAMARPDARTLTCEEAHDLVVKNGTAVMTTGETTYERFVRTSRYCLREEVAQVGKSATRDDPDCLIGYICVPRLRNDR
jgi:hypothetical protein